jgi:hypothetical protein
MFATPGKAGMRQQHDGRFRPTDTGQNKAIDVKTGVTIDLVGPTMAYVKLKCGIPPRFFTDQLSLLKIDGSWQIAQKVFMTEMRE